MKKSSKLLCLVLTFILFFLSALASSSSDNDSQKPISDSSDSSSDASSENVGENANSTTEVKNISIEEQILFDRDGVVITAKEYSQDKIWSDGVKLLVENNREDNITISCRDLIVNHYMISNLFVCEVAAGKKVNKTVDLASNALKTAGIETVAEVEISFHVYETESWETIFDSDLVSIPTSEYGKVDYTPNDSGKELYNDGQIRIVGKYVDENSFWGAGILLYMENNTTQTIVIQARDFSVNGFMMTPYFSSSIRPGRMAMDEITLMSSEMEENGIESVDNVELSFHISDESYFNTIVDTPPVIFSTVNP